MKYVVLLQSEDYNVILGICDSFGSAAQIVFNHLDSQQYKTGRYDNVHFAYGLELNETGCMVSYTLHGDHICESGITESIYILEYAEEKSGE